MPMPDPGADLHVVSLDYACRFGALPASDPRIVFSVPDPVHFTFAFETGSSEPTPGVTEYTWDYTWFVQATVEADIATALGAISTTVAAMLGLTGPDVDAMVTVRRVWTIAPNIQGAGVSSGRIVTTDLMTYP
jgi:hypothetical protein